MWPNRRSKKAINFDESVAYDKITDEDKIDRLVMVYDEKTILLFDKPKVRPVVKKI